MDKKLTFEEQSVTTRQRVIKTLMLKNQCTINELADSVNINPISVRHHINKLEAEGYVSSFEEKHGVGRPRRLYSLTESGRELFPTRYLRLTTRLLAQLKDTLPPSMVGKLFKQMAIDMASDYQSLLVGQSLEERLNTVKKLLNQEGFEIDWKQIGDEYLLREVNCPYFHISQDHPEVCIVDQTLISTLLSIPIEKVKCVLNGDTQCSYIIPGDKKD